MWAVTMMTGMLEVEVSSLRSFTTWYPSMPGIMTSRRIRSGGHRPTSASASSPLATLTVR
jgi:hypothetical protein